MLWNGGISCFSSILPFFGRLKTKIVRSKIVVVLNWVVYYPTPSSTFTLYVYDAKYWIQCNSGIIIIVSQKWCIRRSVKTIRGKGYWRESATSIIDILFSIVLSFSHAANLLTAVLRKSFFDLDINRIETDIILCI